MKTKTVTLIWYVLIIAICGFLAFFLLQKKPSVPVQDCSIMKSGKFKYISGTDDPKCQLCYQGRFYYEYNEYDEQFTKSVMRWVGPCELEMRTVASSYADYDFDPNYVVKAVISNVRGNRFSFTMIGDVRSTEFEIEKVQ